MDHTERPTPETTGETTAAPYDLHLEGAFGALEYARQIAAGTGLRFPWTEIDAMTGPLLPGWLVLFGARAKGGKSTFLREVFNAWVELGKRVVFVGTEQSAGILKLLWACLRLQVPMQTAFDPTHPRHRDVLEDVTRGQAKLAEIGITVADPGLTLERFTWWARYAYRVKADALILDHFHRIQGDPGEEQYAAIRAIKNIAAKSNMVVLTAAQLKQGEGGPLGEYEVPGNHSWAGTANLQRECDLALQGWRPFRPGVTGIQKREARENPNALCNIIQPDTMAIRMSAHRYQAVTYSAVRLYVTGDRLENWNCYR